MVSLDFDIFNRKFNRYFPEYSNTEAEVHQKLIRNPFGTNAGDVAEEIQELLIELQNDINCNDAFESDSLEQFWCKKAIAYTNIREIVALSDAFLKNLFMRTRIFCFTDN